MSDQDNLKITPICTGINLIGNPAGEFVFMNDCNVDKLKTNRFTDDESLWLSNAGLTHFDSEAFLFSSHKFRVLARANPSKKLNYIIAIPTLRCNLMCSYCQVSRANEGAEGFDWSEQTLDYFVDYVGQNATEDVKIEFQGGEPSLRLDLVAAIVGQVKNIKPHSSFVICTNLSHLDPLLLSLLERDDFSISSSLDGPKEIHRANRTIDHKNTATFFENLDYVMDRFGSNKVSLLPTISDYSKINETIDFFREKKLPEIFLRPVNYQGFARKKFSSISQDAEKWSKHYLKALKYICEKNSNSEIKLIETGMAIHLRRIYNPRSHNYVDLRNPNFLGMDYLVVDYDGKLYPTDEARMLSRIGLIDLQIGHVATGVIQHRVDTLNMHASNQFDPTCKKCSFQPFCGVDNIDRISRYGTLNVNTEDTYFCKNHFNTFDFIFKKIAVRDEAFLLTASLCLTGQYKISAIFGGHHFD